MHFTPEPISPQRLQRFHRWVLLWLAWFAGFLEEATAFEPLSRQAHRVAHGWLDRIERVVMAIIMLRAVRHVRPFAPRTGVAQHARKERAMTRAIIGSAIRRALRAKDLRARVARLTQNLDALLACLLRRLPRGLTRRRALPTRREAGAPDLAAGCASPALACDTS